MLSFLGVAAGIRTWSHHPDPPEILYAFAVLTVAWWVSVLVHEVGHVVAGTLVGLDVHVMTAGAGPTLLKRRFGRLVVVLQGLPGGGLTMAVSTQPSHMRWRLLVFAAGGPLASAALLTAGLAVPGTWHELRHNTAHWLPLSVALVMINAFHLVTQFLPTPAQVNQVSTLKSDLFYIVGLPRLPKERLDAVILAADATELSALGLLGKHALAHSEGLRLLERNPRHWIGRFTLAQHLMTAGLYRGAYTHFRALLLQDGISLHALPAPMRALIKNNAAWALFMTRERELLPAAGALSEQALAQLPKQPFFAGTRGAILLEQGNLDEAAPFLRRAVRLHRDPYAKAINLALLAITAVRRGEPRAARSLLLQARKLDPECEFIEWANEALREAAS